MTMKWNIYLKSMSLLNITTYYKTQRQQAFSLVMILQKLVCLDKFILIKAMKNVDLSISSPWSCNQTHKILLKKCPQVSDQHISSHKEGFPKKNANNQRGAGIVVVLLNRWPTWKSTEFLRILNQECQETRINKTLC